MVVAALEVVVVVVVVVVRGGGGDDYDDDLGFRRPTIVDERAVSPSYHRLCYRVLYILAV